MKFYKSLITMIYLCKDQVGIMTIGDILIKIIYID